MSDITQQITVLDRQIAALTAQKDFLETRRREIMAATWPKRVTLYAYCSKETNWEKGESIGLTGEALRLFVHFEEVALEVDVAEDGSCTVVTCNGYQVQRPGE